MALGLGWPAAAWYFVFVLNVFDISWSYLDVYLVYFLHVCVVHLGYILDLFGYLLVLFFFDF